MFPLAAIFIFAILGGANGFVIQKSSDKCTPDNINALLSCYRTFMAGYNITMGSTLPEYWSFHDVRMNWLNAQGLNAQPQICVLGNALSACVAPYTCLSEATYIDMGASNNTEANDYNIDLAVTQYQCGPGYDIGNQEFYCMTACRTKNEATLDACGQQMMKSILLGEGICKAEQQFLNCQSNVYKACCDWNAGVYMCNVDLAGIAASQPMCYNEKKISCPNPK